MKEIGYDKYKDKKDTYKDFDYLKESDDHGQF